MDHPKKTKLTSLKVYQLKQEVSDQSQEPSSKASVPTSRNTVQKPNPNIAITSKEQILSKYLDVCKGIGRFPDLPFHIQVNLNIMPKQTLCRPVPIHLKEAFKQEIDKMLQASIIKPVKEVSSMDQQFHTC